MKRLLMLALACAAFGAAAQDKPWQAIGRAATPAEVQAWDIDVRADFTGLPKGQGSVARGEQVWESRCASCHGTFAESNEVFPPLVGGTTEADMKSGQVAALAKGGVPQRTTLMKLAHMSTLWDYINRAMPWNEPKSLTPDEVYAVSAYLLNLGGIVPGDFTLSDANIASIDAKLPNRNGLRPHDGLWLTRGKGDVANKACMKDCTTQVRVTSFLPDFARNAHGNLAAQHRLVGPVRGSDTTKAELAAMVAPVAPVPATVAAATPQQLLSKNGCVACHGMTNKIVGPAFSDIAARHKGMADGEAYFVGKIKQGGSGVWGAIPMPAQGQVQDQDVKAIARWLAGGAR
jgi:S-disulfanyl-L-cysteine oxidoreductase SoxD